MSDKKADAAFIKEKALVNEVGDIVARLQAGEDVFQEFYEKTKRYVYYIAISNGVTQNDAEDVVQDTFVHFFKKYKEIENPSSAMSWLKRSAFGHSIDCLKKKKDVCLAKDEDTEFDAFDTDALIQPLAIPETALEEKERARIISEIVDSLPEDQKKCVRAFYFDECKIKDIANAYGVPENTVKTNLYRGRKNIEAKLVAFSKKHGIKIVSVAVVPFFSLLFSEEAEAYSVPLPYSAVAQATGTGVAAKVGIGAALKTGREIAAKEIATKVAIAVISVGVISGGIVAGMTYANAEQARVEQKSEQLKKEEESKPVATVASNEIPSQSAEGSREAEPNTVVRPTTPNIVAENREVAAPMSLAEELPSVQAEVQEDDDDDDWDDYVTSREQSEDEQSVSVKPEPSSAQSGPVPGTVGDDGSVLLSNGSSANYSNNKLTINSKGTSDLVLPIRLTLEDGSSVDIDEINKVVIGAGADAITVNTPNDTWQDVIGYIKNSSGVEADNVLINTGVYTIKKSLSGTKQEYNFRVKDTIDGTMDGLRHIQSIYSKVFDGTIGTDFIVSFDKTDSTDQLFEMEYKRVNGVNCWTLNFDDSGTNKFLNYLTSNTFLQIDYNRLRLMGSFGYCDIYSDGSIIRP